MTLRILAGALGLKLLGAWHRAQARRDLRRWRREAWRS